jgi:hypothetical protein
MLFRVSIRAVMAFVICLAVVFASLHEPTELWANVMFTLAVAGGGLALLGVLLSAGSKGVWGGALLFGGGYLALAFAPWCEGHIMPRLVSTALADAAYAGMTYTPKRVGQQVWYESYSLPSPHFVLANVQAFRPGSTRFSVWAGQGLTNCSTTQLRPLPLDAFRQLCHSDASLLLAFLGSLLGRFPAARRDRSGGVGDPS